MSDDWQDLDRRLRARLPDPSPMDVDGAWRRFRSRSVSAGRSRRTFGGRVPLALAATAAVILLAVRLATPAPHADIRTEPGERRTLRLPDGSTVVLAPASRLRYPLRDGASRRVELEGQGWFEIVHSPERPFRVVTRAHEVQVLGTVFGVDAPGRGDSVTVAVASGRVAFGPAGGRPLELTAGQAAVGVRGATPVRLDSTWVTAQRAWVGGTLRFRDTRLDAAVRELQRWFAVDIRLADTALAGRRLTGVIGLDAPDRAFETVAAALGLRLERTGSTVTFHVRPAGAR